MTVRRTTAIIISFPTEPDDSHKLLGRDKAEACAWEEIAMAHGFNRIVIHEQLGSRGPEEGDFVLIYRTGDRWARWGAARQGKGILLWRCANGAQVGIYPTMKAALDTLLDPAMQDARPPRSAAVASSCIA